MFDKPKTNNLRKKIEALSEYLDIGFETDFRDGLDIGSYNRITRIEERLENLEDAIFVEDYFYDCPCCDGEEEILKREAKEFQKITERTEWYAGGIPEIKRELKTFYTTPEHYETHEEKIKEWEDKAEKLED